MNVYLSAIQAGLFETKYILKGCKNIKIMLGYDISILSVLVHCNWFPQKIGTERESIILLMKMTSFNHKLRLNTHILDSFNILIPPSHLWSKFGENWYPSSFCVYLWLFCFRLNYCLLDTNVIVKSFFK